MKTKEEILPFSEDALEGCAYYSSRGAKIVDLEDAYKAMDSFAKEVAVGFLLYAQQNDYHIEMLHAKAFYHKPTERFISS